MPFPPKPPRGPSRPPRPGDSSSKKGSFKRPAPRSGDGADQRDSGPRRGGTLKPVARDGTREPLRDKGGWAPDSTPRGRIDDAQRGGRREGGYQGRSDDRRGGFGDKPRGNFGDKPRASFGDKPRGNFADKPRGGFGDKPRGNFADKPRGDFGDRPRPRSDDDRGGYQGRSGGENRGGENRGGYQGRSGGDDRRGNFESRGNFADKPRGAFGDRPRPRSDDDRGGYQGRSGGENRGGESRGGYQGRGGDDRRGSFESRGNFADKPRGGFGDKPRAGFGDKPRTGFGDKPRGDFGDKPRGTFGDRPRGNFADKPKGAWGDKTRARHDDQRAARGGDDRGGYQGRSGGDRGGDRGGFGDRDRARPDRDGFAPRPPRDDAERAEPRYAAPAPYERIHDSAPFEINAEGERIAKLLARAGIASRRDVERMIVDGRVTINDALVLTPATILTTLKGVAVDGKQVGEPEVGRLWAFHKPDGLITAERDPAGRPTIYTALRNALPPGTPRLMPVGRLDFNTEGLLLMTNDGELKRAMELPSTGVPRTYRARTFGDITQPQLEELMQGIEIDGFQYGPINANMERRTGRNQWVEVTLTEGKNREVRTVLEHLGLQVSRLLRISYGPFMLGDLPRGSAVALPQKAVEAFRKSLKPEVRPEPVKVETARVEPVKVATEVEPEIETDIPSDVENGQAED